MAIPDYQTFMYPVLRYSGSKPNNQIPMRELFDEMAKHFKLSDEDLREMLPSGATTTLGSRVGWACTYLKKALLLESPKRGHIQITARGLAVLAQKLDAAIVDGELLKIAEHTERELGRPRVAAQLIGRRNCLP